MGMRSIKRRRKAQRKSQLATAKKLFKFHFALALMQWLLDSKPAFILYGVVTIYRVGYLRVMSEICCAVTT